MFDLSKKSSDQIITTIAPIAMADLQKYFEDEEIAFVIDYENSTLRGKAFMSYIANIAVPCDIHFSPAVTKEERFELILEYMNSRNLVGCQSLAITVGVMLTALKGIDDFYLAVENPILNQQETLEFIMENQILVNQWKVFMDSIILFTMASNEKYVSVFGHPKDQFHNVDDDRAVGNNVVNLFDLAAFMEFFFSVPGKEVHYFTKQFEDYMFGGQNLFFHFMKPTNPLPAFLETIGSLEYDTEKLFDEMDAIESKIYQENDE